MPVPSYCEPVFCKGHPFHDRLFYDNIFGSYWDRARDLYLTYEQANAQFGMP